MRQINYQNQGGVSENSHLRRRQWNQDENESENYDDRHDQRSSYCTPQYKDRFEENRRQNWHSYEDYPRQHSSNQRYPASNNSANESQSYDRRNNRYYGERRYREYENPYERYDENDSRMSREEMPYHYEQYFTRRY